MGFYNVAGADTGEGRY